MKKTLYFLIIATFFTLLTACSFQNEAYENAIEDGFELLKNRDYAKARNSFSLALDEKAKDDEATILLQQTILIMQAESDMTEGNLDASEITMTQLVGTEDVSPFILAHIEEMKNEIATLKTNHKKYTSTYSKAKSSFSDNNFDDTLQLLATVVEQDLNHNYYATIKQDINALEKEVTRAKKVATAKIEEKRKEEERIATEKKEAELKAKKEKEQTASKDIGFLEGYWYNPDLNTSCFITPTFIHCAVPGSDNITRGDVTNIEHINNAETLISYSGQELSYDTHDYEDVYFDGHFTQIDANSIFMAKDPNFVYYKTSKEATDELFGGYELE